MKCTWILYVVVVSLMLSSYWQKSDIRELQAKVAILEKAAGIVAVIQP